MTASMFDYGRDALDFIDSVAEIAQLDALIKRLEEKLRSYGFGAFLITGLPGSGEDLAPLIMMNGWPRGWFQLYQQSNFILYDPMAARVQTVLDPFVWSEVVVDRERRPKAAEVMHRAEDFGMIQGFCVPIHGSNGFEAVVTMAGDKPDLSTRAKAAIHLIAVFVHGRASTILRARDEQGEPILTTREREILTWLSLGKSTEEVSDILGVMKTTVTQHYNNASQKLGTRGRTRTVIEAFQRKEIKF
jgi:LuxR family transcriptional regulator, quorum-sensing system regulator BjaR1